MTANYVHTLFTAEMRALQQADGSRGAYERMEAAAGGSPDMLSDNEIRFISARDSFYLASVTSDGWPYVQHRGGPPGFLKVLDRQLIGFADFKGNRQHVSSGNALSEPRISLFLMDYPNRRRLKILGSASLVDGEDDPSLAQALMPAGYRAVRQRCWLIDVVAFDWNCPQHITPRYTEAELELIPTRSASAGQASPPA